MSPAAATVVSRTALFGLLGFVALVVMAGIMAITVQQHASFSQSRIGGPFEMEDMNGQPVTEKALEGLPSAISFGYTSCPDLCPTTLSSLSTALGRLGPAAQNLNTIFVTVDPERDTPTQMRDYLSAFDSRIRGFTGTLAQTDAMAQAYHVYHRRVAGSDGSYTIDHSATVYLMNAEGRLAGEINYGEDEARMTEKLRALLQPAGVAGNRQQHVDLWADAVQLARRLCGL